MREDEMKSERRVCMELNLDGSIWNEVIKSTLQ